MTTLVLILLVAALVAGIAEVFGLPSKVSLSGVGVVCLAIAALIITRG